MRYVCLYLWCVSACLCVLANTPTCYTAGKSLFPRPAGRHGIHLLHYAGVCAGVGVGAWDPGRVCLSYPEFAPAGTLMIRRLDSATPLTHTTHTHTHMTLRCGIFKRRTMMMRTTTKILASAMMMMSRSRILANQHSLVCFFVLVSVSVSRRPLFLLLSLSSFSLSLACPLSTPPSLHLFLSADLVCISTYRISHRHSYTLTHSHSHSHTTQHTHTHTLNERALIVKS
jgi:hypothetical protein